MLDKEKAVLLEKNVKKRIAESNQSELLKKSAEALVPVIILTLQEYEKLKLQKD